MELRTALACDAAVVREGLLHILSAPITRIWRSSLPAPLGISLALILCLEEDELEVPHQIDVRIEGPGGPLGTATGAFQANRPPRMEAGETLFVPSVVPLHKAATNAYGRHTISFAIDTEPAGPDVDLWVLDQQELQIPPLR